MTDPFLTKLYHPAGLAESYASPEGWRAALLRGMDTPGIRAETQCAREERVSIPHLADRIRRETKTDCRATAGKVSAKQGAWKGSRVEDGHVMLGDNKQDYPARVYYHPSGATCGVRVDVGN